MPKASPAASIHHPIVGNSAARGSPPDLIEVGGKLYIQDGETLVPLREADTVPVDRRR